MGKKKKKTIKNILDEAKDEIKIVGIIPTTSDMYMTAPLG